MITLTLRAFSRYSSRRRGRLYARDKKRGGAWMDDCRSRKKLNNGEIQHPIAYLNCNFMPAAAGEPILLTHDEVVTLFHEFGHTLQT